MHEPALLRLSRVVEILTVISTGEAPSSCVLHSRICSMNAGSFIECDKCKLRY